MVGSPSYKIGFVFDDSLDHPDGVQQYMLALSDWLVAQGHEVHFLTGQTKRKDIANVHSLSRNIGVRFNGNRLSIPLPASRRHLKALLVSEQFDILHVQVPYSPWLAQRVIMAAPDATAIVGTFHIAPMSGVVTLGTRLLALWTRRSLKRFDYMVSVSSAAQTFARQTYKLQTDVVYNMFNYERFHRAKRLKKYTKSKSLNILFLGRLVPRKGCRILLEAVALLSLRTDLPNFKLIVAGRGPLEAELKQYCRNHKIESIVEFTGFITEEDKPSLYASADIAVFPSSGGESFGIVLLEAMANGRTTVLAGDNPGYRSVMAPRPDLLFDPHSPAQLAELLSEYLLSDDARRSAANWGHTYSAGFDSGVVGRQIVGVYNKALHK